MDEPTPEPRAADARPPADTDPAEPDDVDRAARGKPPTGAEQAERNNADDPPA